MCMCMSMGNLTLDSTILKIYLLSIIQQVKKILNGVFLEKDNKRFQNTFETNLLLHTYICKTSRKKKI